MGRIFFELLLTNWMVHLNIVVPKSPDEKMDDGLRKRQFFLVNFYPPF